MDTLKEWTNAVAASQGIKATGAPETFLISNGQIVAHFQGEVNDLIWKDVFLPIIEERKMF